MTGSTETTIAGNGLKLTIVEGEPTRSCGGLWSTGG